MINPWFKFYGSEYLSDPKIGSLTAQERSCWVTLLCMASTASTGGIIEYLTVEVLLEKSGIRFDPYHPEEWDSCLSILAKFERMNMIEKNENGSITVKNWSKRQESTMTATERSRKYRAKIKENRENATNETQGNENATLEKNRIEKNRINNKESVSQKKFKQPTLDEVEAYCKERENGINPQNFIDFYSSKGWKVGNQPMKDWQACVRTWENKNKPNGTKVKTYKNPQKVEPEIKITKIQA